MEGPGTTLQDFKHLIIFWQNIEQSCMLLKIYGVGKATLAGEMAI